MWKLGEDDWIKYGWGPELSRNYNGQKLFIKIKKDIPVDNLNVSVIEAVNAVNQIVKKYPPPYILMCSGGVDSQAMLWAWHVAQKPYIVQSIKYMSDGTWFNEHDLVQLAEFTTQYKIPVEYKNFDVIQFLETELSTVSEKYNCASPHICSYIQMISEISKGTIIFAGNYGSEKMPPALTFHQLGMHRYAIDSDTEVRKTIPFFFLHSQALANSFKKDNDFFPGYGYQSRCHTYQFNGYPVMPQRNKFTGFEMLKIHYDQFEDRISAKTKFMYHDLDSYRPFDLLFRYPLGINKYIHKQQVVVTTE